MKFIKRRKRKRELMIEEMKLRVFYESNIRKLDKILELQFGSRPKITDEINRRFRL